MAEQYEVYTMEDFVADVGGYMGLFLGASILSMLETFLDLAEKVKTATAERIF